MGHIHNYNGHIIVNDSGAASQLVSSDLNEYDLSWTGDHPDETGFGATGVARSSSTLQDAKLTVSFLANSTGSKILDILEGLRAASTIVMVSPAGSSASSIKYILNVVLDDFSFGGNPKVLCAGKATFSQCSGSLTKTTWA